MKKLILMALSVILVSFTLSLAAAPASTAEASPQDAKVVTVETATAESMESEAEAGDPGICLTQAPMFPGPNHCGDPCSEEGETMGCIDTSGPFWKRVECTCLNGSLVC